MSERSTSYPEVRIRNGWLLAETVSPHLPEYVKRRGKIPPPLPTTDEVNTVVSAYREAWEPRSQQILSGICRILGLSFRKNIVDVHIAPGFRAVSQPLIMGTGYEPDHFIDALTHELFHDVLVDNTTYEDNTDSLITHWRSLFGAAHSEDALIHIPVHAGLAAMYQDVLREPYRLERDIGVCQPLPGYSHAWDYVQRRGYHTVINQLVTTHRILAENQRPPEVPPPVAPSI